jgi:sphinganine-1-phosphate aldolase
MKAGLSTEEIRQLWQEYTVDDMKWKEGKFFGYVYYPGDEYYSVIKEAYAKFSATNALNPAVFPSLKIWKMKWCKWHPLYCMAMKV